MKQLDTSLAVITGASSGIGRELARLFARDGHSLFLIARDNDNLFALKDELEQAHGIVVYCLAGDLTDEHFVATIPDHVAATALPLGFLVNNAGSGVKGSFLKTDWQREHHSLMLNSLAPTLLTKLLTPTLVKHQGSILFFASMASVLPGPGMAVYYATKAYLLSLAESLSCELAPLGVSVTTLLPGPTVSGFQSANGMNELSPARFPGAASVAHFGYQALMRRQAIAIPGWKNRIIYFLSTWVPRGMVRYFLTRRFQK